MNTPRFEFVQMLNLLGRSERDVAVRGFFGESMDELKREDYWGSMTFHAEGVDVGFKAAQLLGSKWIGDPDELVLSAFFLHREGHHGHSQYRGAMPNAIAFSDSEASIVHKMGAPLDTGRAQPILPEDGHEVRWIRYEIEGSFMHVQFDGRGVNMITLMLTKP